MDRKVSKRDITLAIVRGVIVQAPWIGYIISELMQTIIPSQREERIINFVNILDSKLEGIDQDLLRIKFTKVASLPKASLIAAVGKVNSDVWRSFSAETVMFNGVETETKWTTSGLEYTVGYSYSVNFFGWNKRFRPSAAVANHCEEIEPNPYQQVSFAATFGF